MFSAKQRRIKRIFDIAASFVLTCILIVPMLLLLILAAISMKQSGLFFQLRVGRNGKLFRLYKLRTLKGNHHEDVLQIKKSETKFGYWLRSTKLDELPQLFNVLKGEMSMVGPRPDIPGYADKLKGHDRIILTVKPGITGPATIKYKNEDVLLIKKSNPKEYNDLVIWPDKVAINKEYVLNWSLLKDIGYLWSSVFK